MSAACVWPPPNAAAAFPDARLATFAGGCFWGVELAFQHVPGVVATSAGYAQGHTQAPTYEQVCSGGTGHAEAVQLLYRPAEVSFGDLCALLLKKIDPWQKGGQGVDIGSQYRSGIYPHDEEQRQVAAAAVAALGPRCAVEVEPYTCFWPAEEYHQSYLQKMKSTCSGSQSACHI